MGVECRGAAVPAVSPSTIRTSEYRERPPRVQAAMAPPGLGAPSITGEDNFRRLT